MQIYEVGFRDLKEEDLAFGTFYVRARNAKHAEKKIERHSKSQAVITYIEHFKPKTKRHYWWVWFWTLFGPYDDGQRRIFEEDEPTQYILR